MWNDEDNNPYGTSIERRDSYDSTTDTQDDTPTSPNLVADNDSSHSTHGASDIDADTNDDVESDEDYAQQIQNTMPGHSAAPRTPKVGGYDSRIEQILYENPDMPILIVDAGKSSESGGKYIVYTIRTGELEVRRRYSEFASLRDALARLHPTLIIPPIPEKHTMADYAVAPAKAKQDQSIIDLRKRMLAIFLNRCRIMDDVRNDGVWWRFLDPNSSWSEVLHSHPISSIPKSNMKAPPLDPANPSQAHSYLIVPPASAKLKAAATASVNAQGMVNNSAEYMASPSSAAHSTPAPQVFGRFPPDAHNMSEQELDGYFINFEASTKELEHLLTGPLERANKRVMSHLMYLSNDLADLGARYNGFSLSEPSPTLAASIERIGQAVDSSYIATEELHNSLSASYAEPLRESAQFAGVVRTVLRFRVLKRVQQEMIAEDLAKKRASLEQLERSEIEAQRIESYLSGNSVHAGRRPSTPTTRPESNTAKGLNYDDVSSIDSDFPPTHSSQSSPPSATQGAPASHDDHYNSPSPHRKSPSGNFITNKIFGRLSHAVRGVADVDPEKTRRDNIGRTKENIGHLEMAQDASAQDVKDASAGVLRDLKRFQKEKEDDMRRYMVAYAKSQVIWARKNEETWKEARAEVLKIDET